MPLTFYLFLRSLSKTTAGKDGGGGEGDYLLLGTYLSSFSCYDTIPQAGWLLNDRNLLLTVLEAGNPRLRCQHGHLLARPLFLLHG